MSLFFVYLDDILMFSSSPQEHNLHVHRVLQCLLENRLFVKAKKCVFHADSLSFFDFVISAEGISMDPSKMRAVIDWPIPDSRTALQRFSGICKLLPNVSQVAVPFTALTSTKSCFSWSEAA